LQLKRRYGVPPVSRETIYRSFLPQLVEHTLGRGRRVYSRVVARNDLSASTSDRPATRKATPDSASRCLREQ
jgi:hypothetical protein